MSTSCFNAEPRFIPSLDKKFRPASLELLAFKEAVRESGNSVPLVIALERGDGLVSAFRIMVFPEGSDMEEANLFYAEKIIKTHLWIKGGWKLVVGGPERVCEHIRHTFKEGGKREFDARFMSRVYEKPFTVEICDVEKVPLANEETRPAGGHLKGCRIGFDAGGSDRKVSAVVDGEVVYSEEVIWHPKTASDPAYHYNEILTAMRTAASHMPRVDAIGVSSAGIYVKNRIMVASLFIKVADEAFEKSVKNMYLDIQKELGGVPMEVANDGDVTALAGAMELEDTNVLGIAMGTSEAGGYVDGKGNITGWLNELAFVPVDFNPEAIVDEWSGDYGCGVKYFSQDSVIKLAHEAGIVLPEEMTPAQKLEYVQNLLFKGDAKVVEIFENIGIYLGYALAYYAEFYDVKHVLILGRVTSGKGGELILANANKVLEAEFPEINSRIKLHLPDESSRRVGQSIAAASLTKIAI